VLDQASAVQSGASSLSTIAIPERGWTSTFGKPLNGNIPLARRQTTKRKAVAIAGEAPLAAPREQLRERLIDPGPDALADIDLLEMLLSLAAPGGDATTLAEELIGRFGSFANVLAAPTHTLLEMCNGNRINAAVVKLVRTAAIRLIRAEVINQPVFKSWDRLMEYLNAVMGREKVEEFRILFLDTKNRLLADEAQGRGTVNQTPVYPREVVKRALERHATALILVHNHPSGNLSPSPLDVTMTQEVKSAALVLGIELHDHVIVGNGGWLSLRKEGLL